MSVPSVVPVPPRAIRIPAGRGLRLAVLGLGSVGSRAAESIARTARDPASGLALERVVLVDRDVLEAANLIRHAGLPADVGRPKVELVAERVRGLVPGLDVRPSLLDVTASGARPELEAIVADCDLCVASFDNAPALFQLNEVCAALGRPLFVCEVISGGIGLWLHAVDLAPGGPCLVDVARARGEDLALAAPRGARAADYSDPGAAVAAARVPADDWACTLAGALLAREVVLAARHGIDPAAPPLRLIALQRVEDPAVTAFFREPFQCTAVPAPRQAGCFACDPARVTAEQHAQDLAFFGAGEAA